MSIRALVVDDSILYRKVLASALERMPAVSTVDTASGGVVALSKIKRGDVDLVFLDLIMPDMDGMETLAKIKESSPQVSVVIISGADVSMSATTMSALAAGALDFIPKPSSSDAGANQQELDNQIKRLLQTHEQAQKTRGGSSKRVEMPKADCDLLPVSARARREQGRYNLVALGISTGGPQTLDELMPLFPENLGCPLLIVQHMPASFTTSLAKHLNGICPLTVKEASQGDEVLDNHVYIAPGDFHMTVVSNPLGRAKWKIDLNQDPHVNACRPAVDVLFSSLAQNAGVPVVSCVLTGMGHDGAAGVAALRKADSYNFVQNKESCVVYGMPKVVSDKGLAEEQLSVPHIAARIIQLVKGK